jgi:hemolysin activation/secretion protein
MLLFGGINSIRGFEENSITTNKLNLINFEYRLKLNNDIYFNSIFDTAHYENKLTNIRDNIYGVGFGLNINTNSGVFRINYANGIRKGQDIDLKLSKIHVSFSNIF